MGGFHKITFGDDGAAKEVACAKCSQVRCFCVRDIEGNKHEMSVLPRETPPTGLPTPKKFNWKRAIRARLKENGGVMKKKQLRSVVIAAFKDGGYGGGASDCPSMFRKALKKASGVSIVGKTVTLEGTGASTMIDAGARAAPEGGASTERESASGGGGGGGSPSIVALRTDEEWMMMMQASMETAVVVDFTASWCGPCQQIAPHFARLCAEHPKLLFVKVDVDEMEEAAEECGVTAMPTFQIFRRGQNVDTLSSGADPRKLSAFVQRALRYAQT
jgi:thioredoxin 1